MEYNNIATLIEHSSKLTTRILAVKNDRDFWWRVFSQNGGYHNYKQLEEAEAMLKYYESEYERCRLRYNQLKNISSNNNNLVYAITIGSAERVNTVPCESLWNRFINSADGKRCDDVQAFFEKGDNGYIHIHAIVTRDQKWSRSIKQLQQRYGKYQGKQHNFDIKRLHGIEQNKWKNYIRKDSHKEWNKKANEFFLS